MKEQAKSARRAAIYVRDTSKRALAREERDARALAERQGLRVEGVYRDKRKGKTKEQYALDYALKVATEAGYVIVARPDHLSHDSKYANALKAVVKAGASLALVSDSSKEAEQVETIFHKMTEE